jgi:hypothetical protein
MGIVEDRHSRSNSTVVKLSLKGVQSAGRRTQSFTILPANRRISWMGDAEFEPASSAV